MDDIDPFEDARPERVPEDSLLRIAQHAERMLTLQKQIATVEDNLKALKEALRIVQEVDLPEAMDAVGMADFTLKDGGKINIKGMVNVSIYKDKKPHAYQWLRDNGHGGIIKTEVSLFFGKGEDQKAQEVVGNLREQKLSPELSESVNTQTLNAWAREMVQSGKNLPDDLFSVFTGRKAIVLK